MRRLILTAFTVALLITTAASAQVRGRGRLQGNVHDKATGQPVAGATITISGNDTTPIVVKSDSRGHWAAIGMTSGQWNIDIAAPGYITSRGTANISEVSSAPPINIELNPEPKAEPQVPAGPSLTKEAADAITEGQTLLRAEGTADEQKANAAKAVADFEKALPQIPDSSPAFVDVRNQVYGVLANAYYKSGDVNKAIATLEKLDQVDPGTDAAHQTRDVLLANLYLENGQLDQGRALLDKLPPTAITDATAYINIGILFLNKKDPTNALTYFTKAVGLDAKNGDAYYYRALAEIQLKKNAAAKADLQQVIALAPPGSTEVSDAKQLLASLK